MTGGVTGAAGAVRFLRFGVDAVLVEVPDVDRAVALHDALVEGVSAAPAGSALAAVVELVPAARTVLVRFDPGRTTGAALTAALRAVPFGVGRARGGTLVEIPVRYDGEDLDAVAALTGLSAAEVVRRHTAATYDVAFTGFAPGFAYLSGGDPALVVPRRPSPRTAIPAGAVAIAGPFSGVYPRASPGGWQLLGRTAVPMWDLGREHAPALLRPGMRVRFSAVEALAPVPPPIMPVPVPVPVLVRGAALEVLAVGPLATVQDLGRPGHAALGVARSGAMDRPAIRRANRLVGNRADAGALEHAGGGLVLRAVGSVVVAVTGADVPLTVERVDGDADVEADRPLLLDDGDVLTVGTPVAGVSGYVAVLGGIDVPPVLGSRATDVLSGLGPAPITAGTLLPVGQGHGAAVADAPERGPGLQAVVGHAHTAPTTIDVVLGPRDDWCTPDAVRVLTTAEWTVTTRSNRVGIRLAGSTPLERAVDDELPSEAMVPGAIQVPPDGQPVVFGADHPVTGGYPVVATVTPASLAALAQVPPGRRIRFRAS